MNAELLESTLATLQQVRLEIADIRKDVMRLFEQAALIAYAIPEDWTNMEGTNPETADVFAVKLLFDDDKTVKWVAWNPDRGEAGVASKWWLRFLHPDRAGAFSTAKEWRKKGFKARVVRVSRKTG